MLSSHGRGIGPENADAHNIMCPGLGTLQRLRQPHAPPPSVHSQVGDTDLFPIRDDVNWAELGESMGLGGPRGGT